MRTRLECSEGQRQDLGSCPSRWRVRRPSTIQMGDSMLTRAMTPLRRRWGCIWRRPSLASMEKGDKGGYRPLGLRASLLALVLIGPEIFLSAG